MGSRAGHPVSISGALHGHAPGTVVRPGAFASERLVDFCRGLRLDALPPATVQHARRHLIDTLGAMLIGAEQSVTRNARAVLQRTQGTGRWPVVGQPSSFGLLDGAWLGGVAAHGTESDDGYREGSMHPGAVVLPALLGLAWSEKMSGSRLLEAMIVGYEASGAVARAVHPHLRRRGFHPTSAVGAIGAAMAAAKLLSLTRGQTLHALGIAGSSGAGLFAFNGGGADVKRLHTGHAAREGLLAAMMAAEGCEAPTHVLEAQDGFFQAFAGLSDTSTLCLPPDAPFVITVCYVKPYACCRHLQPAVEALQTLVREHSVQPEEIEAIEVETYSIANAHAHVPWTSFAEAQLSFPFVMASGARFSDLRIARFGDAARADPVTEALCGRVQIRASQRMDARYPAQRPAEVTLKTTRGTWSLDASEALGAPELPLGDAQLEAKFVDLAGAALGAAAAQRLLASLWTIDQLDDVSPLIASTFVELVDGSRKP